MTTIEEAKQYLLQVAELRDEAIVLAYKLAEQKKTSKRLIASYELSFGGSKKKYDISDEITKIKEKEQELQVAKENWLSKRQEIECFINNLQLNPKAKQVLSLKYICCDRWKDISDKLYYSERQILRLHLIGLKKVANNLKNVSKCQ